MTNYRNVKFQTFIQSCYASGTPRNGTCTLLTKCTYLLNVLTKCTYLMYWNLSYKGTNAQYSILIIR